MDQFGEDVFNITVIVAFSQPWFQCENRVRNLET